MSAYLGDNADLFILTSRLLDKRLYSCVTFKDPPQEATAASKNKKAAASKKKAAAPKKKKAAASKKKAAAAAAGEGKSNCVHLCFHPECCRYQLGDETVKNYFPPPPGVPIPKSLKDLPKDWTGGLRIVNSLLHWNFDDCELKDQEMTLPDVAWLLSACFDCNAMDSQVII